MRPGDALEAEGRNLARWLESHPEAIAPLRTVRVESAVDIDDDGQPTISLTVVLEDPEDPDAGWPIEAVFRLYRAVSERARDGEHSMPAYVHMQSVSDEAA